MLEQISLTRETMGNGTDLLLCADATKTLAELAAYEGKVQCVYIDPPFMTGDNFTVKRRYGESGWRTGKPSVSWPAYSDAFPDRETYLNALRGWISNAHRLLAPGGVFCLHLDWHSTAYGRLLCDEIFGEDNFINEVIWTYDSGGRSKKHFSRKHDNILLYGRTPRYRFDLTQVPISQASTRKNHMKRGVDPDGRTYRSIVSAGKEYRYYDDEPVYPSDVWTDISHLQQRDPERWGFATQKPLKLLDRLLRPVVKPGDIVCDLCCGSGTTLVAAQALGCHVIGVDVRAETLTMVAHRINAANLTSIMPVCLDDAMPEIDYQPESGLLLLHGFSASDPLFPATQRALDPLESWGIGTIHGDEVRLDDCFMRTPIHPELPIMHMLPPGTCSFCLSTVDAAGRKRVYLYSK